VRRALLGGLLALAVLLAAASGARAAVGIDYSCSPGPCDTWHNTVVTLRWTAIGGTLNCPPVQSVTADGVQNIPCSVSTSGPGTASDIATVRVDRTPPSVTGATTSRIPDHDGWYRAPVVVTFAGTDATSGLSGCSSLTYAGPDGDPASVGGTCTDIAGNVSAVTAFPLRYDVTAPALAAPAARGGDGVVRVRWQRPADAASLEVVRSPGRHGAASSVVGHGDGGRLLDRQVRNGHRYRYTVRATDQAGNTAQATASAVPGRRLLAPARGAVLQSPPRLAWTAVRGARYYNVQLFRNGRKVLSRWPRRAHLALEHSWRYAGRRYRLSPGRYSWYVWPGRGRLAAKRYGRLIGHGRFVIART
jgi:hypothetical protein